MCDHKHRNPKEDDPINHPSWYTEGGIQPLDYIESQGLGHSEGNIIEYLTRAGRKGPRLDDLLKAEFYIKRLIEREKRRELAAHEQRVVYAALDLDETGKPLRPCGFDRDKDEEANRVAVEQGLRPADKVHVITVGKKTVYIPSRSHLISVKDIKLAAKVPLAYDLAQIVNNKLVVLDDDAELTLKGGKEFIGQPKVGVGN